MVNADGQSRRPFGQLRRSHLATFDIANILTYKINQSPIRRKTPPRDLLDCALIQRRLLSSRCRNFSQRYRHPIHHQTAPFREIGVDVVANHGVVVTHLNIGYSPIDIVLSQGLSLVHARQLSVAQPRDEKACAHTGCHRQSRWDRAITGKVRRIDRIPSIDPRF